MQILYNKGTGSNPTTSQGWPNNQTTFCSKKYMSMNKRWITIGFRKLSCSRGYMNRYQTKMNRLMR
jgi:hypothetical protein